MRNESISFLANVKSYNSLLAYFSFGEKGRKGRRGKKIHTLIELYRKRCNQIATKKPMFQNVLEEKENDQMKPFCFFCFVLLFRKKTEEI